MEQGKSKHKFIFKLKCVFWRDKKGDGKRSDMKVSMHFINLKLYCQKRGQNGHWHVSSK